MADSDLFDDFFDEDIPLAEVVRRKREREKQKKYEEREEELLDAGEPLLETGNFVAVEDLSTEESEQFSDIGFVDHSSKVKKYVSKSEKAQEKKERKEAKEEGKKARRKAKLQEPSSTDDSHPSADEDALYLDPDRLWGNKGESVSESSSSFGALLEKRKKK